jgi:hypothetical protein
VLVVRSTHLGQDLRPSSDRRTAAGLRSTATATVAAAGGASTAPAPAAARSHRYRRETNNQTRRGRSRLLQRCDPIQFGSVYIYINTGRNAKGKLQADLELGSPLARAHGDMDGNLCDDLPPSCTAPRHVGGGRRRGLSRACCGCACGAWSDALTERPVRDVVTSDWA